MTRKENNLAKTCFYKLQHLKPIIELYFLVIDRIFVWVFLPHLLDPVNSNSATCVNAICYSTAVTTPTTFVVMLSQTSHGHAVFAI